MRRSVVAYALWSVCVLGTRVSWAKTEKRSSFSFCLRDAMLAPVLAIALCLVCVCHKSVFFRNGWTNWAGFWYGSFLPSILHYTVLKGNSHISKNKRSSLWNFVQNSRLRKFCLGISIVETCYRLSSTKVDAPSVINWTVIGQLSWQYLRAPTLDCSSLSQVIVKLCLQHDSVAWVS